MAQGQELAEFSRLITVNSTANAVTLVGNTSITGILNVSSTGQFGGAVSGITTLAAGNTTITGTMSVTTNTLTVGTSTLAANGYIYLHNGVKYQWMTVAVTNAAAQALAWPVAFTGTPYNVQGTISGTGVTVATIAKIAATNATHITANSIGTNTNWFVTGVGV